MRGQVHLWPRLGCAPVVPQWLVKAFAFHFIPPSFRDLVLSRPSAQQPLFSRININATSYSLGRFLFLFCPEESHPPSTEYFECWCATETLCSYSHLSVSFAYAPPAFSPFLLLSLLTGNCACTFTFRNEIRFMCVGRHIARATPEKRWRQTPSAVLTFRDIIISSSLRKGQVTCKWRKRDFERATNIQKLW